MSAGPRWTPPAPVAAMLVAGAVLGGASLWSRPAARPPEADIDHRPVERPEDAYVSSDTCRACHPSEYASWHTSFHRTMTQVATPDTIRADFDGVVVADVHGAPMRLERRNGTFWAEFDDPGWEGPAERRPRVTREVVMITGSHHQQIYWYATGHDRALNVLPGVYLLDDERWVPRSAVVLHPPGQGVAMLDGHWNAICVACHTTSPRTRFDSPFRSRPLAEQAVDTTAVEFGIACEACHGPAEDHVRLHRSPVARYRQHLTEAVDDTIVTPTRLDARRGSQVCGQCHSVWEFPDVDAERQANARSFPYRPGDELTDTRFVAHPMADPESEAIRRFVAADPEFVRGSFWPDGMIRVSGREYNGLVDSPCFRDATEPERTLTCFSCHVLHQTAEDERPPAEWADTHQVAAWPDDETGDAACLQCHEPLRETLTAHTRHDAASAGSRCVSCHMPYTSYGLLQAVRSHTISSPSVEETVSHGRPNACNLCHLDQTLAWTGERLEAWYGQAPPALAPEQQTVAAALLWTLTGDAGLRALTAWSMGWPPAQAAAGTSWMPPHLFELMNDPYDAVRYIAARSLEALPGHTKGAYDYVAPREDRVAAVVPLLQAWQSSAAARERTEPRLLVAPDGALRTDLMRRLFDRRDTRPLFLRE